MTHLRITGITWLAFGVLGACAAVVDLARNITSHAFAGAVESDLIAAAFCIAAVFGGYALFLYRVWARVVCGFLGFVLFLYTISYFLMVGLEFGVFLFVLIMAGMLFSVYSLFATVMQGRAA
jgi:hypothetical protein